MEEPIEQYLKNDFSTAELAFKSSVPEYGYGTSSSEQRYGKPKITKHGWRDGALFSLTVPKIDEPIWASFDDCRQDYERELALCIQEKRPKNSNPYWQKWHLKGAVNYLKESERMHWRLVVFYGITKDGCAAIKNVTTGKVRRLSKGKKADTRKHKNQL